MSYFVVFEIYPILF